jgi:predicted RNA methylase
MINVMALRKYIKNTDTYDKYYTKQHIVELCIQNMMNYIKKGTSVLEPSAGSGAFIEPLERLGCHITAIDISPANSTIIQEDFLTHTKQYDIIIGNPPFGRNSSTALKFINKATTLTSIIGFILPRTFLKSSIQEKIDRYFHLELSIELPRESFLLDGISYDVPCVFQVWKRYTYTRDIEEKIYTSSIIQFTKKEDSDLSIIRCGGRSGVLEGIENINKNTHYFIKVLIDINWFRYIWSKILPELQKIAQNTAGVKSISKQEIFRQLKDYEIIQ